MTTIQVTLSESLQEFVRTQISENGYDSASDFIQAVLKHMQSQKAREKIDSLLLEGINSGPSSPLDAKEWESIRKEARARLAAEKKQ